MNNLESFFQVTGKSVQRTEGWTDNEILDNVVALRCVMSFFQSMPYQANKEHLMQQLQKFEAFAVARKLRKIR